MVRVEKGVFAEVIRLPLLASQSKAANQFDSTTETAIVGVTSLDKLISAEIRRIKLLFKSVLSLTKNCSLLCSAFYTCN